MFPYFQDMYSYLTVYYDVSLTTKTLILLAASLLTSTTEPGIEIPSVKQSLSGVKAIDIVLYKMPKFASQLTVLLVLDGIFI